MNVQYRDVKHLIPFLLQVWMYGTPIIYPASLVPERFRSLYDLNPMAGVVMGFRWALLGQEGVELSMIALSGAISMLVLFGGAVYFRRMERSFADVI